MVTTRHGIDTSSPVETTHDGQKSKQTRHPTTSAVRLDLEQYAGVENSVQVKKRSLDGNTMGHQASSSSKRRRKDRMAEKSGFRTPEPDEHGDCTITSTLVNNARSGEGEPRAPEYNTARESSPLAETSVASTSRSGGALPTRQETEQISQKPRVKILDIHASANALTSHARHGSKLAAPSPALAPTDIEQAAPEVIEISDESDVGSDDDSEREAPEAIGLSAAKAQIRAQAASTSEAIKLQDSRARRSRQERAVRLREQVEASDRRKKQKYLDAPDTEQRRELQPDVEQLDAGRAASADAIEETVDEDNDTASKCHKPRAWAGQPFDLNNLPALLPPELLETEAPVRSPTPPSDAERKESTARTKHLSFDDKYRQAISLHKRLGRPAPDIVRGPVNVSVLPRRSTLLPPQAETRSKELRNYWAKGRPSMLHESKGPRAASGRFAKKGKMERRVPFAALKQKFA